jgi:hypothetical protein
MYLVFTFIYSLNKSAHFFDSRSLIFEMSAFTNFSQGFFHTTQYIVPKLFQYTLPSYQEFAAL